MTDSSADRRTHWQRVYQTRAPTSLSWYQPHLGVSLELLSSAGLCAASRVIDVGGGTSTLVDDLLSRGVQQLSVLDISQQALSVSQERLGLRAATVTWLLGDVLTAALPAAAFDFWHDRAVLHFLSEPTDTRRYAEVAATAVIPGGHCVIGGFAPDGPERCSGLPVTRRAVADIAEIFAAAFELEQERSERHRTPSGAQQSFVYALLRRR